MATVVFDFDSTLINRESLEEILRAKKVDPKLFEAITRDGMAGKISFSESLEKRLTLANLTKDDFLVFGQVAKGLLVPGMKELISQIEAEVWIVSGMIKEVILPTAKILGIPDNQVLGIELDWTKKGARLQKDTPVDKVSIAKKKAELWSIPKTGIGDGITDWELYNQGLVDDFIAFTGIVRRPEVLEKKGVKEAKTVDELKQCLSSLIPNLK